jgi:hypothetical protein
MCISLHSRSEVGSERNEQSFREALDVCHVGWGTTRLPSALHSRTARTWSYMKRQMNLSSSHDRVSSQSPPPLRIPASKQSVQYSTVQAPLHTGSQGKEKGQVCATLIQTITRKGPLDWLGQICLHSQRAPRDLNSSTCKPRAEPDRNSAQPNSAALQMIVYG